MNYPFIRRTVALALALFFALTLSAAITAPGWAQEDSPGSPSPETSASPEPGESDPGSTEPSESDPGSTEPGESDPGSTEPGESDPGTPPAAPMLTISGRDSTMDPGTLTLTATLTNPPEGAEIAWSVEREPGQNGTKLPLQSEPVVRNSGDMTTSTVTFTFHGAGEFVIMVQYEDLYAIRSVTVSGIVLSGDKLVTVKDPDKGTETDTVTMYVNGTTTLTATPYGNADDRGETEVIWLSDDASVVYAMPDNGILNALGVGKTVVTALKGDYSAECEVTVVEDTSVIADRDLNGSSFTAAVSEPLILGAVYPRLERICRDKTLDMYGKEEALNYITNLKVSPDQGTLYYNYSAESDTGDGVGYNDQFRYTSSGSVKSAQRLSFVPARGFVGTAEITFSGISTGGRNFTGVIRVRVDAGAGGAAYRIDYAGRAGEPVWFSADDFDVYCRQNGNGRGYNYITFNPPKSSDGALYYNYVAGSGNPVNASVQFSRSGRYTVDDVCFVPNTALADKSKVTISFRAVDTSGAVIEGEVTVNVSAAGEGGDPSSVFIQGERGKPVTLSGSLFNDACRATIGDTLSFVTFRLPAPDQGMLYYNYRSEEDFDSRVAETTRYYYSGVPGLSGVSFVPAGGAAGRVAISYTGYGSGGASYSGTLYVALEEVDRSTIYYSVPKGGSVTFSVSDFNDAGRQKAGSNVSFVIFNVTSDKAGMLGTLHHKSSGASTQAVYFYDGYLYNSSYIYYASPENTQRGLGNVYFDAKDVTGTVTISYTAYSGTATYNASDRQELFSGNVVIRVGSIKPEDVMLSCNVRGYAQLNAPVVSSVCGAAMGGSLSYIEITGLPAPKEGRLYLNYSGFGTGTAVKPGDRLYRAGSPGIGQLSFVPNARFIGEAVVTYIGCSADGKEQVSGRIVVNVRSSASSQYFTDMKDSTWAIDSVDYLYWNKTVLGVGDNRFAPDGIVTRGDFVLMLVRAFGFTAAGNAAFSDVPADSYYADAIRTAYLLGVVNGYNGCFYPQDSLTRQDAMLMIYNALKVSGKTPTNGLAANLSAYQDEGMIAAYAREAMGSLVQLGVVKGDGGGCLWPQRQLTRAEAAVLLHTIMTL